MTDKLRVMVWNEGRHEKRDPVINKIYPNGIHAVLAGVLSAAGFETHTATLDDDAEHGLSEATLAATDVLLWWGHMAHNEVRDEIADRVHRHVLEGMGLVVLHSSHVSKPFLKLLGTTGRLKWRDAGERERIWCVNPTHPIAQDLPEQIVIEQEEMYGEHFDIPTPDELVFISWFQGGEVFRSGCCWRRGLGKVFYFRPGHESFPTYYQKDIQQVIINSVKWARPDPTAPISLGHRAIPDETIR